MLTTKDIILAGDLVAPRGQRGQETRQVSFTSSRELYEAFRRECMTKDVDYQLFFNQCMLWFLDGKIK